MNATTEIIENITEAIEIALDEWLEHVDSAKEINQGGCYLFAVDVQKLCAGATIVYDTDVHACLVYDSRYYDAECPNGVDSRDQLPLYRRAKRYKRYQ